MRDWSSSATTRCSATGAPARRRQAAARARAAALALAGGASKGRAAELQPCSSIAKPVMARRAQLPGQGRGRAPCTVRGFLFGSTGAVAALLPVWVRHVHARAGCTGRDAESLPASLLQQLGQLLSPALHHCFSAHGGCSGATDGCDRLRSGLQYVLPELFKPEPRFALAQALNLASRERAPCCLRTWPHCLFQPVPVVLVPRLICSE